MNSRDSYQMAKYKDFEKYDPRRYLVVLFAVERLKERATLHYIAQDVDCTRAEVQRAIESGQKFYMVDVEKEGPVYRLKSWGILNKSAGFRAISPQNDTKRLTVTKYGL